MSGWDVVITFVNQFPPVAMAMLLTAVVVAVVIGIVGFSKHGMDFIKHGFEQNALGDLLDKLATKEDINELKLATKEDIHRLETRIDNMETRFEKVETRMGSMETELATIKVNHFGHLKDFLTELTSILLDKKIIENTDKTRLDNQLRGM
jgi:tRNA U34 5-carboxymethylaminomethyl modifying enzyme MnmG/GidA